MHGGNGEQCSVRERKGAIPRRERGVWAVVALTAVTMVAEVVAGYATGSMALLADGWHMATHVGALGLAALAYAVERRYANHRAFAFGTGKVQALAGYTSAVTLGLVALLMAAESVTRLVRPGAIDFAASLPVAVVGLVVNVVSVALLHDSHEHEHDHDGHDHNHRAALLHVVADTLTSALAIGALLAGKLAGVAWLDPLTGVVAAVVILKWSVDLSRRAALELLDVDTSSAWEDRVRALLEGEGDTRVTDLHVWSLGGGARSCVVTVASAMPRESAHYRTLLAPLGLAHLTIEVQRCASGHDGDASSGHAAA